MPVSKKAKHKKDFSHTRGYKRKIKGEDYVEGVYEESRIQSIVNAGIPRRMAEEYVKNEDSKEPKIIDVHEPYRMP